MRVPSGLNATLITAVVVAQRLPDRLPGGGVPQPDRLVDAAGGDAGAVGAERHTGHRVVVAQRLPDGLPGRCPTTGRCCPQLPEAMRVPSGLNATLVTASS